MSDFTDFDKSNFTDFDSQSKATATLKRVDPEAEDKLNLADHFAKQGMSPGFVYRSVDAVSKALYGAEMGAKQFWGKVKGSWDSWQIGSEIDKLRAKQILGDNSEETQKQIDTLDASLPREEERLWTIPDAILNQFYSLGKVAQETGDAALRQNKQYTGPGHMILNMAAGVFAGAKEFETQIVGGTYHQLMKETDDQGRKMNPTIAKATALTLGGFNTALMLIPYGKALEPFVSKLGTEVAVKLTLGGIVKRAANMGVVQGAYAAANSLATEGAREIARTVNNKVNGTTFTNRDAWQFLHDAGIEFLTQGATGMALAAPGLITENVRIAHGGRLEGAVKEAMTKIEGQQDILEVPKAVTPPIKEPTIEELINSPEFKQVEGESLNPTMGNRVVQMRKFVSDLKSIDTSKMHPDIKGPINDILDQYNLASPSKKTLSAISEIKDKIADNPEAELQPFEKALLDRSSRKNFRDLSFDEARAVHDAVMYYDKLQRDSTNLMIGMRKADRAEVAAKSIEQMPKAENVKKDAYKLTPGIWDRAVKSGRWIKNLFGDHMMGLDYLAQTIGGKEDSDFNNVVFRQLHGNDPIKIDENGKIMKPDANGGERGALIYRHTIDDRQSELRKPLVEKVKSIDQWRAQRVQVGKFNLTRGERVSIYSLWNQDDSRRKLASEGGGFGSRFMPDPNNVYRPSMDEWYELLNSITPEEKMAAKALSEGFKEIGEDVQKQHVTTKNYELDLVENYFPEDVMPISRKSRQEIEESIRLAKTRYAVGIPKGRTISREGVVKPLYVRDAFNVFAEHRDWASNYIHIDRPAIEAHKLLQDTRGAISSRWGPDLADEIEDRIRKTVANAENDTKIGRLFARARGSYVGSVLSLNPISIAANLMNVERATTAGYVKPSYSLIGLMDSFVHPREVHRQLKVYSPEYREYHVEGGFNKDYKEALEGSDKNTWLARSGKMFKKVISYPSRLTDRIAVRGIMRGSYFQAMDEIQSGHLSTDISKALNLTDSQLKDLNQVQKISYAYRYGEYVLEHVNSVPSPTLQSGLHLGNWFEQTVGTFGHDAVRAQQLYKETLRNALHNPSFRNYRKLGALTVGLFLIEPLHYVILNYERQRLMSARKPPSPEAFRLALSGDKSKEAKEARRYLAFEFLDQASYYFPVLRDVVRPIVAAATKQYSGQSMLITDEYTRLSSRATQAAAKLARGEGNEQKNWSDLMDNGGHLLATMLGIPYTSPQFWFKAVQGIASK